MQHPAHVPYVRVCSKGMYVRSSPITLHTSILPSPRAPPPAGPPGSPLIGLAVIGSVDRNDPSSYTPQNHVAEMPHEVSFGLDLMEQNNTHAHAMTWTQWVAAKLQKVDLSFRFSEKSSSLSAFTRRLGEDWGVMGGVCGNGMMILYAVEDNVMRIETDKGKAS
jgi:hypothetical protein